MYTGILVLLRVRYKVVFAIKPDMGKLMYSLSQRLGPIALGQMTSAFMNFYAIVHAFH